MSKIANALVGVSMLFNASAAFAYDTTGLDNAKLPQFNAAEQLV